MVAQMRGMHAIPLQVHGREPNRGEVQGSRTRDAPCHGIANSAVLTCPQSKELNDVLHALPFFLHRLAHWQFELGRVHEHLPDSQVIHQRVCIPHKPIASLYHGGTAQHGMGRSIHPNLRWGAAACVPLPDYSEMSPGQNPYQTAQRSQYVAEEM